MENDIYYVAISYFKRNGIPSYITLDIGTNFEVTTYVNGIR